MFSQVCKKIMATTLAVAMVASAASVISTADTASAAKAKLSKTKVTISMGEGMKLKASAKAKWSTSDKLVVSINKKKGKSVKIKGIKKGSATITAKIGSETKTCKVTVGSAKSGKVIYDLAKETGSNSETGESYAPPVKCPYSEFKYSSFRIWLCQASLYDPANSDVTDYRGVKLNFMVKLKNSGKHDLAELGFCLNYTKGGTDGSYPFVYHVIDKKLRAKIAKKANKKWSLATVKKDKQHRHCTVKAGTVKKGKTYTFKFSYTIPSDAMNGDKDPDTGINYPIMFYIPNLKDNCPYTTGDEITVQKCKISVA